MTPLSLSVSIERFAMVEPFMSTNRLTSEAVVVVAELTDGSHRGRGECTPDPRFDQTAEQAVASIAAMRDALARGLDRIDLQSAMPAGAARNALDCAFWDLAAKQSGTPVYELAGLAAPAPVMTAYTIGLGTPAQMAQAARAAAGRPLLKIKLSGENDRERLRAIRLAAPKSELIADANQTWDEGNLAENLAACAEVGVTLIEQPLPAANDAALAGVAHSIVICADESLHDSASISRLAGRYDAVNIKLDKAGGLTEALKLKGEAKREGLDMMVGCRLGTSLAMAPALLLAQGAIFADLDGPLFLTADRPHGLRYEEGLVHPGGRELWG